MCTINVKSFCLQASKPSSLWETNSGFWADAATTFNLFSEERNESGLKLANKAPNLNPHSFVKNISCWMWHYFTSSAPKFIFWRGILYSISFSPIPLISVQKQKNKYLPLCSDLQPEYLFISRCVIKMQESIQK